MLYELYFSPTGGTKKAADYIANGFDLTVTPINFFDKSTDLSTLKLSENDIVLVAAPCYGGRAPEIAINDMKKLKGNGAKAVAIAVYGNRATDDQLAEMQDVLSSQGFKVVAGVEALAEHSLGREIAKGRPNMEDKKILETFGSKIEKAIKDHTYNNSLTLPGNRPYKLRGAPATTVPLQVNKETCIGCNSCTVQCPTNAIPEEDPTSTNPALCISCMHCTTICPTGSRIELPAKSEAINKKLSEMCPEAKENKLFI